MSEFLARSDFAGRTVLVCGARTAGASAARALATLGATVLVTDRGPVAAGLPAGARFLGDISAIPSGTDALVTSPGWRPDHPLLIAAADACVPVFGELEFAWRIRDEAAALWLMVTGTNGKTTTVRMLESILVCAGRRALAVGNVGVPIIDAVMAEPSYEVLAVEASSFQLHHSSTIRPHAGVLLNIAPDHLDWHGSMWNYSTEKAKVWAGHRAIRNADDVAVSELFARSGASVSNVMDSFTLGEPDAGQYGVRADVLVDGQGRALLPTAEVRPPGSHNVANALAAAALAETVGVEPAQVAVGLRAFVPDPHRNHRVASVGGVDFIDDSKATNAHAAAASMSGYDRIVWIAGGQLKDAPVDELVAEFAPRMRAAVLLGVDRELIAAAFARHAPDLPVIIVSRTDDRAMYDVVAAAASLAAAGDVVLLAPAAASLDMYSSYSARGKAFADAVAALNEQGSSPMTSEPQA
ncbi:UDP-N-acetylmuramoyl-L-alanine--D-glutamate ligase [Jatrophihabitans sp. DSM 45814]